MRQALSDVLKATGCVLAVLLGIAVLGIAAIVGALCWSASHPSADSLQQKIEKELKSGDSIGDIENYLATDGKKEGIQYDAAVDEHIDQHLHRASDYSDLRELGIPPDTLIYQTILRRDPHGLLIYFILDDERRLVKIIVTDYYTSF